VVGNTPVILCAGLFAGVISKLLDIYTVYLGDIFSRMSVWIFICTLISVNSVSAKRAAVNVFCFCEGMLGTYYVTAMITKSVCSPVFAFGWGIFALFSPLMGVLIRCAKGKAVVSAGAAAVTLLAAAVLFDRIRPDIVLAVLTGAVLLGA